MFKIIPKIPSRKEEIGNFITHTVGTALSITGLIFLIVKALKVGGGLRLFSFLVFGVTLIVLYLSSSLYHGLPLIIKSRALHKILKICDHSAIFLLIAGTYTPFTLVTLSGSLGLRLFIAVWSIAILGIVIKAIYIGKFPVIFTVLYIAMGWLIAFAIKPLFQNLTMGGIIFLFAGGFFYTFGVVFYALQRLTYNHFIWHFFVLAGSVCHYFAILLFV